MLFSFFAPVLLLVSVDLSQHCVLRGPKRREARRRHNIVHSEGPAFTFTCLYFQHTCSSKKYQILMQEWKKMGNKPGSIIGWQEQKWPMLDLPFP